MRLSVSTGLVLGVALLASPAAAQQITNPTPGCKATPAEVEQTRQAGIAFSRQGATPAERVALADPSYKQHNPAFVKGARDAGMNDYDYFKSRFGGPPRQGGPGPGGPGGPGAGGPTPPQGNPLEIVMVECDLVTIIHKNYRQDPTAAPGTFYEVFTFDTFRVKNGKFTEHWDGAVINAPAPPGAGRGN
jgi:predicted SnoaL-like aldol condensation-catalyzing enzyme